MNGAQAAATLLLGGNAFAFVKASDLILAGTAPEGATPVVCITVALIGCISGGSAYFYAYADESRFTGRFMRACQIAAVALGFNMAVVVGFAVSRQLGLALF